WPLPRTNQARAFDAYTQAAGNVAPNEDQGGEMKGLGHAARPVSALASGSPRGFSRRRSDTAETIGRQTVTDTMS
ncbi:hypothetical protein ACV334_39170, partial [Pseudomonas aeruginosa]